MDQVTLSMAFGGILKIPDVKLAFILVKDQASVYEEDQNALQAKLDEVSGKIIDKDQKLNFLLVAYGLALTNAREDLFQCIVRKLGPNIGSYSSDYAEAMQRTDPGQRELLELLLVACIASGRAE